MTEIPGPGPMDGTPPGGLERRYKILPPDCVAFVNSTYTFKGNDNFRFTVHLAQLSRRSSVGELIQTFGTRQFQYAKPSAEGGDYIGLKRLYPLSYMRADVIRKQPGPPEHVILSLFSDRIVEGLVAPWVFSEMGLDLSIKHPVTGTTVFDRRISQFFYDFHHLQGGFSNIA